MGEDVIAHLTHEHDQIRTMFGQFDQATRDEQMRIFGELVERLARHETAEEEVVYPVLRREVSGGEQIAEARIAEEHEAEQILKQLEDMGLDHPDFGATFARLRSDVLDHADAEEREVFPELRSRLSDDRLRKMGDRVETAEAAAPTHPHPNAPKTPPGIFAAGMVAAAFDRARDRFGESR